MSANIGISASILTDQDGMFPGYKRCYVNQDYIEAVVKQGGIPFVLPITDDSDIIEKQIDMLDGLILSGGHDVSPALYHEDPLEKLGETLIERDQFDFQLIKAAIKKNIPILGICRGAQILNVYFGGTLYQDTSYRELNTIRHWQSYNPTEKTHQITIQSDTRLEKIFNETSLYVNSFHHQLIHELASNFKVNAYTNDRSIEGFESKGHQYIVGIQWHPEMLWRESSMDVLFKDFINQAESM
ncbi:gamma-glutamyl-gamma-aminobutyrate hydrolase family protein [Staphylococcus debuckii]|uniref:gamma-glutamyl-gamma-aminobutyrate hydrolase family protein n=1 Tax=Staphylococcus debuckii TaxID=2044912 RepID=UPI000F42F603|nr:gamma-glutamyl-gamma-aminobutyrate hydrolase family protein [Staphylococcus debuckii]AYU54181.1 gamma-glutamyl-gamma-aminobutyrate hydrolase family protein [Staphylococcus debuckii]